MVDPIIWIRQNNKPFGRHYYEYFLAYVDGLIILSHNAKVGMTELLMQPNITFKNDTNGFPKTFICSQMEYSSINGMLIRKQHSQSYIRAVLTTIQKAIEHWEDVLPTKSITSFSNTCHSELDTTPELKSDDTRLVQE